MPVRPWPSSPACLPTSAPCWPVASAQSALVGALDHLGQQQDALSLLRNVVATRKRLLGTEHPLYAGSLFSLGHELFIAKQWAEAETTIREALALSRRTYGNQHSLTIYCLDELGDLLRATGRFAEAETAYREAHPRRVLPGLVGSCAPRASSPRSTP